MTKPLQPLLKTLSGAAIGLLGSLAMTSASAGGVNPYIGEIVCFPYDFAPNGWALAQGQLLPIASNTALFSIIGTTYGGDGRTTFALPDLRGRSMINGGQGPGLSNRVLGETGGQPTVTLTASNMPPHAHTVAPPAARSGGTQTTPANGLPATDPANVIYHTATAAAVPMATTVTAVAGGSQPYYARQPFLGLSCAIALTGIYPSRQ